MVVAELDRYRSRDRGQAELRIKRRLGGRLRLYEMKSSVSLAVCLPFLVGWVAGRASVPIQGKSQDILHFDKSSNRTKHSVL